MSAVEFDPSIFLSLAFLFGIAAQFRAADGHSFLRRVVSALEGRLGLLYAVVAVVALSSPFLLNDVLVLIFTPVLIAYSKESGTDIAPLLVAEITFTNLASALTPLGNPQNILLWQASGISAAGFVAGTWAPLAVSGVVGVVLLSGFRGKVAPQREVGVAAVPWSAGAYLAGTVAIVFALSFLRVSSLAALGAAFAFGFAFTFRTPGRLAREYDLRSLLMLCVLVGAVAVAAALLGPLLVPDVAPVAAGTQPYTAGFFAVVSAAISNVPATQLVLSTTAVTPHAAPVLAVDAGLAGNIDPVSSFANLLALTMVKRSGLPVRRAMVLQLAVGLVVFLPAALNVGGLR
jgi:Na+/H+ antiporter NhaD/arsenite permease-like protein